MKIFLYLVTVAMVTRKNLFFSIAIATVAKGQNCLIHFIEVSLRNIPAKFQVLKLKLWGEKMLQSFHYLWLPGLYPLATGPILLKNYC